MQNRDESIEGRDVLKHFGVKNFAIPKIESIIGIFRLFSCCPLPQMFELFLFCYCVYQN